MLFESGPPSTANQQTFGVDRDGRGQVQRGYTDSSSGGRGGSGGNNDFKYAEVRLPKGTTSHQVNLTKSQAGLNNTASVAVIAGPQAKSQMNKTTGLTPKHVETTPKGETVEYFYIPDGNDAKVLVEKNNRGKSKKR